MHRHVDERMLGLTEWMNAKVCVYEFCKNKSTFNIFFFGSLEKLIQDVHVPMCMFVCVQKMEREQEKEAFKEFKIQSISTILTFLPFLSSITLKFLFLSSQVSLY